MSATPFFEPPTDEEELENQVCREIAEKIVIRDAARALFTALQAARDEIHNPGAYLHNTDGDSIDDMIVAALNRAKAAGL